MSEIDWSKAPEGCTHYVAGSIAPFEKREGDKWSYWSGRRREWIAISAIGDDRITEGLHTIVERPSPAWSGGGLPPVGAVCEYFDNKGEWYPAVMSHIGSHLFIVKYQHPEHGQQEACMHIASNDGPISSRLRPIRTPEQIAADERLHEIRNAMTAINSKVKFPNDLVRGNILAAAIEAMIDAGYRKP